MNLIRNGNFEADWGDKHSHACLIFPGGSRRDIGNIFTPPDWLTWFFHEPGTWDQPEVRDAHKVHDKRRVRSGSKAILLFTFWRRHKAGFLQRVQVEPGQRYRLTAWAHAWSNHHGRDDGGHVDDGRWSDGAGYEVVAWQAGSQPHDTGDPQQDAKANFTFRVGIDPTGGLDPFAGTVVWGQGYHIYNGYCRELEVEATASAGFVTVFLYSETLWGFKHNDAYWDDVCLEAVGAPAPVPPPPPPSQRGKPRVQYERTYVLLPPQADAQWATAVVDATWDEHRYTIGGSADDAGIGDLDVRNVIAVNPGRWQSDLEQFFREYYPGVRYKAVSARTPEQLRQKLSGQDADTKQGFLVGLHDDAGLRGMHRQGLRGVGLAHFQVQGEPVSIPDYTALRKSGIRVLARLNWGYADGTGTVPPRQHSQQWIDAVRETITRSRGNGIWGWIIGNEINNPTEWPGGYPSPAFIVSPDYYAELYNAIKDGVGSGFRLAPAPLDPYNVVAGRYGMHADPREWAVRIYDHVRPDFIALHAKTQTNDVRECSSAAEFSHWPLLGRFLHLRTVEDQLSWVPRHLQVDAYVTELNPQRRSDSEMGWDDRNSGWVTEACAYLRTRPIAGVVFYRFEAAGDQAGFGLERRSEILAAIAAECRRG